MVTVLTALHLRTPVFLRAHHCLKVGLTPRSRPEQQSLRTLKVLGGCLVGSAKLSGCTWYHLLERNNQLSYTQSVCLRKDGLSGVLYRNCSQEKLQTKSIGFT